MKVHFTFVMRLILVIAICGASCNRHSGNIGIEYGGTIVFSADKSHLDSISPKGFIQFNINDDRLMMVDDDKGNVVYELNGEERNTMLQGKTKVMFDEAVKYCQATGLLSKPPYILKEKK